MLIPKTASAEGVDRAIVRLLADVSDCAIEADTRLDSLGLSSIAIQTIVTRLEDEWQLRLPILLLFDSDTVADLIAGAQAAIANGELAPARPPITRLPRS